MSLKIKMKELIKKGIKLFKSKEFIPIPQPINTRSLLKGKNALITGGSGGIGLAIAEAFLKNGANVVITGRKESVLESCCDRLVQKIPESYCEYIVLDVIKVDSISQKVSEAATLLNGKIDILVNSAGLINKSSFEDITEKEYDAIMNTNTKGTFFLSQAVAKHMIESHIKGHILNVTSSSALRPAWTPYQMSKWAIRGFTMGLADLLLPYGIVVNAIAPGPTATPMLGKKSGDSIYNANTPAGRYIMPSEIANLAVFMVSDMANMVIGNTFYITGGSGTISYHK